MEPPAASTVVRVSGGYDLGQTLGTLRRGRGDPTLRDAPDGSFWWALRTPLGNATLQVHTAREGVEVAAWGPGAEAAVAGAPAALGAEDDPSGFDPRPGVLRAAWARCAGWRVTRTGRVFEALVPTVLEQRVTGAEARAAYRTLVLRYGEPAPGPAPAGLRVPPAAATWRRIPSWEWHRAGVDRTRSRTITIAAQSAGRVDALGAGPGGPEAQRRLRTLPGVGEWTAAEVAQRALGDADAVSVGDYHLPALVGWALAGRPLDDEEMLELLEPYRPHRYRVTRILELAGPPKPAFGPRHAPRDYRAI